MTLKNEFTDLKTSRKLQEIMEKLGIEAEAWWLFYEGIKKYYITSRVFDTSGIKYVTLDNNVLLDTEPEELEDKIKQEGIPAYTFFDLWKVIPEWVNDWFKFYIATNYHHNGDGITKKIIKFSQEQNEAILDIMDIFNNHWDNWLLILSEMVIYLDGEGMTG